MPPTLARETHCPMAPLFLPAVPSLAPCHRLLPIQSREKEKKEKTEPKCDEIVRPVTSRNGTFYRSGIKPGENIIRTIINFGFYAFRKRG